MFRALNDKPDRDDLAVLYLDQLAHEPYPIQEEALLQWFTNDAGVLVCAPTGMGKTLIAEAAMFEALHSGTTAYYTTPLIALTEQKYQELREAAVRWGFSADAIGLVTGNRRVNPEARVLVVVAEILLNRLLNPDAFEFGEVSAVVMDEFHSFNDPERGIVWELSLGLLPANVRLLLLSATVGNSREFVQWMYRSHRRKLELVEGAERRVPLTYQWVGDTLLGDQLELMAQGAADETLTPSLVFCFNREQCWTVAEHLKGKKVVGAEQKKQLDQAIGQYDFSAGAGTKLRQILMRGVGVHHAGLLPRYRRIVEELFQQRLVTVCVCTETLAAGINLPARSVVLPSLLKGPPGDKKVLDPSSAHQMFGRAGRPQFDSQGYVVAMAHEDDVKHQRWKAKYDQIPEDTKDPGLRKAKKALKKKNAQTAFDRAVLDGGSIREAPHRCAGTPGQPRVDPLATLGALVGEVARGVDRSRVDQQAVAASQAARGGAEGVGSNVAHALASGLCDIGSYAVVGRARRTERRGLSRRAGAADSRVGSACVAPLHQPSVWRLCDSPPGDRRSQ